MRRIVRLHDHSSGRFNPRGKEGSETLPYARFEGYSSLGKKTVFFAYGDQAKAFEGMVDKRLESGRDVHEAGLYVEVSGEMIEGKRRADGRKMPPYFKVKSFDFLEGFALEVRKLRHQMAEQVAEAKRLASEGNLDQAFEQLRDFMERESGVVLIDPPKEPELESAVRTAAEGEREPAAAANGEPASEAAEPSVVADPEERTLPTSTTEAAPSGAAIPAAGEDDTPPEEKAAASFAGVDGDMVFADNGPEEEAAREMNLDGSREPAPSTARPSAPAPEATSGELETARPEDAGGPARAPAVTETAPERQDQKAPSRQPSSPAFGGFAAGASRTRPAAGGGTRPAQAAARSASSPSRGGASTGAASEKTTRPEAAKSVQQKPAVASGNPFASPFGR